MKYLILMCSLLASASVYSEPIPENDAVVQQHKKMLLTKFPDATFTEIEKSRRKGRDVYEYEFKY